MNTNIRSGFVFTIETLDRDGNVIDVETQHNLMPTEGMNHMLSTEFAGGAQVATWYVGIFEGNYTPTPADVASTFPSLATECTAYAAATRPEFVEGAVVAGAINNSASKAEFVFTADKTVYGGFISSAAAKGAVSGVLASIVRFASPKSPGNGGTLRVTAGITLSST